MQQTISRQRVVLLLLVAVTSSAVIAWFALKYTNNRPMAFEKSRWMKARDERDGRVLNRMSKDLIQRQALIGESRSQLIEQLGEPEKYTDAADSQMYYLIREEWDWIDPVRRDHLFISFDANGRVAGARIDVWRKKPMR